MRPLLSYKPSKLAMRRSHRIEAITHIINTLIIVAPNKQHFNRKLLNNLSRRCLKKFLNKPFSHEVKVDCNDLKGRLVQDFFAMYNTILFGDTHSSLTLYLQQTWHGTNYQTPSYDLGSPILSNRHGHFPSQNLHGIHNANRSYEQFEKTLFQPSITKYIEGEEKLLS